MIQWQQLSIPCSSEQAETLEGILLALGAQTVTFEDAHDQPILEPGVGETPLWSEVVISALFDLDTDIEAVLQEAQPFMQWETIPAHTIKPIHEQAWERAWMDHYKPIQCGKRLWVYPSNHTPADDSTVNLLLDPGLAFGSGTHPTTYLCLAWLDSLDLKNKTVIDYGCGSGILGIAAVKLGAPVAHCIDNDPQALIATRDNAERNGLTPQHILVYTPEQFHIQNQDILIANILAGPLQQLAGQFAGYLKPGGLFAISGILDTQIEDIKKAYQPYFDIQDISIKEGWVRVSGIKH